MSKTKLTPFAQAIAASRWPYALSALLAPGLALANPVGGNITGGTATISVPDAAHTVINQASNSAVIQWQSFNVGQQEYVIFNQPSASAAVLNRVVGGDASTILGHMQSNGRVFLVNPFGVFFGQGAKVDVGSLMASTLDIADQDFLNNKFVFKAPSASAGSVVNQGNINAGSGGFVVLAGDYVKNAGVITAKLGDVVLASGSAATLNLDGNGLVNVVVDQAALSAKAGVDNVGQIAARGGTVVMTARVARELMQAAVNNTGTVSAQGITEKGGDIYLTATGGSIANSGTLDTSGHNGNDAGDILIQADHNILLTAASKLDFTGRSGGVTHIVADRDVTLAKGSTIDGRSTDLLHGHGGFAELSGHGKVLLGSLPTLGKGGTLLLDPDVIDVYGGFSSNCVSSGGTLCLSDSDLSASITSQNTMLVAGGLIFFEENANVVSTTPGNGLLVGIGQVSGNQFVRSAPTAGYGGVVNFFNNGSDAFATVNIGGKLEIYGGLGSGSVSLGNFTASSLHVEAASDIFASNVTVNVGSGALELKSEKSYVGLYGSTFNFGNAVIQGDSVNIGSSKLTGDSLTLTGNSSNEDAVHVYGGSMLTGRSMHFNAPNGGVQIGNQFSSGYGDEATLALDAGGELVINAAEGRIDHSTVTSSGYGGYGGALTVNVGNFFDVTHSSIAGTSATITGHGDFDGDGNTNQFISSDFQMSQRLEVNADEAIEISNSFLAAPDMVLNSGTVLGMQYSTLSGNSLSVSTGGDGIFTNTDTQGPPQTIASFISYYSNLQFSKGVAVNAGGSAEVYGGFVIAGNFNQGARQGTTTAPPPSSPPVGDVVLHATGAVRLGAGTNIRGDRLTVITAGASPSSDPQATDLSLTLGDATIGSLTGYTLLIGRDGVAEDFQTESAPQIYGNALDIAGRFIHLANSNITVDAGAAVQGHDDFVLGLIAQHEPSLLPSTAQPNAAFVALEDVALGTVNFINGHYMFVRAGQAPQITRVTQLGGSRAALVSGGSGFTFGNLNYDTSLLLNYTPADPTQNMSLDPNLASSAPAGVTLMLGGSTYLGDITVATAPVDAVNGQNFVFATQGSVLGADLLKTAPSARVLVLDHITFGGGAPGVTAQADDSIKTLNGDAGSVGGDASSEVGNSPIEYSNQKDDDKSLECT